MFQSFHRKLDKLHNPCIRCIDHTRYFNKPSQKVL
uniref:Uncharacterized protein n=1 Tax=Arundo donax TaxID=35708 RepID=A0A0A9E0I7_ARUDO